MQIMIFFYRWNKGRRGWSDHRWVLSTEICLFNKKPTNDTDDIEIKQTYWNEVEEYVADLKSDLANKNLAHKYI